MSWLVLWKDIDVIPQDWGQRKRYRVGDECCLGCAPFDMSLEHLRGSIRRVGRVALRGSTWRGKRVGVSTTRRETKTLGTDVEREEE